MNPQQPLSPPPTTPKKEVHTLGPRPVPLKLSKDSVKIKKAPLPHPHLFRHNPPPQQQQQQPVVMPQQQQQQPVVIYSVSPKVIHTSANEFMSLVLQRLNTGPSSSPPGDFSPAARLASIEKTTPSSNNTHHFPSTSSINTSTLGHGLSTSTTNDNAFMDSIMDSIMELGVDLMGQFPSSILSPSPAAMQPIPAGFFSQAAEDPQNGFSWQGLATGNNQSWQELGTRSSAEMAGLAVREALAAAEKVLIALYQRFERPTKLHDDVEIAQNCLKMMQACVRNSVDPNHEDTADTALSSHTCRRKFLNIAYRIEDVLDEFMIQLVQTNEDVDNISQQTDDEIVANFIERWEAGFNLSRHINDVIEKNISFVKIHLRKSCDDCRILRDRSRSRLEDSSSTLSYQYLAAGDDVVGFEEHQGRLIKELIKEDSNFSTILIVGPGGSGKSTLAKNIFENKDIRGEFDCHIWVTVPRRAPLQLDELLKEMLTDLGEKPELVQEGIDPKSKLRFYLQHKRSLFVLDDVWRKQDLRIILKALPNGARGSKVMITSRNSDVVSFLSSKYIYDLSPGLDREKGKELLWKKAGPESREYYHGVLELSSAKIVRWCGGLPLAISEIGSLLATKPVTVTAWSCFLGNLGSEIKPGSSLSIISRILQPSYMDLPIHLKTCFLYLRVFPAGYKIQAERLIHMWVAEGFVEPRSGLTMEQVAEGYLDELIGRSLVVSVEREIRGRIRTYLVVSLLVHDFIFSKEENFITVFGEPPCRTCPKDTRRLSVYVVYNENLSELINIRTLVVSVHRLQRWLIGRLLTNKFLRLLDLKCEHPADWDWTEFPEHFGLRYLKLTGFGIEEVHKSIRNLRLLETLIVENTRVSELPEEICQLHNLRHLLFDYEFETRGVKISPGIIEALSSIQTLRGIEVTNTEIVKALRKLKGLRELEIKHLPGELGRELCISLEKMEHLSTLIVSSDFLDLDHMQGGQGRSSPPVYLQHLYLTGRLLGLPKWISQLTSLQKLGLCDSKLNANPLEVLQALPHLIELSMFNSYEGEELLFKAKTFKKLMKLYVTRFPHLNLVVVEVGALPLLKELHISRCPKLNPPPEGIDGLNSLCKLFRHRG